MAAFLIDRGAWQRKEDGYPTYSKLSDLLHCDSQLSDLRLTQCPQASVYVYRDGKLITLRQPPPTQMISAHRMYKGSQSTKT